MIRNRLISVIGFLGLSSAAALFAGAVPSGGVLIQNTKATAPAPIAPAIRQAQNLSSRRGRFAGTRFKTTGNRAQRRRQLAGMMMLNGVS